MSTILTASSIITMDPARPWADAVALDEQTGRILAVGTLEECRAAAPRLEDAGPGRHGPHAGIRGGPQPPVRVRRGDPAPACTGSRRMSGIPRGPTSATCSPGPTSPPHRKSACPQRARPAAPGSRGPRCRNPRPVLSRPSGRRPGQLSARRLLQLRHDEAARLGHQPTRGSGGCQLRRRDDGALDGRAYETAAVLAVLTR